MLAARFADTHHQGLRREANRSGAVTPAEGGDDATLGRGRDARGCVYTVWPVLRKYTRLNVFRAGGWLLSNDELGGEAIGPMGLTEESRDEIAMMAEASAILTSLWMETLPWPAVRGLIARQTGIF